jgi:Flp pilus assembly protein TadG
MQRDERGAALLEFALVFGIFVFVLYGLIAFGMILSMKQTITHAATEGARAAIGVTNDPATPNDEREDAAKARVASALSGWNSAQVAHTDVVVSFPNTCPTTCIKVHITYHYKDQPLVPPAPGLGLVTPDTLSSDAIVALS